MAIATSKKARTSDSYNLEARLEALIHHHLTDMEDHPEMYASKDRLAAIQYIGMFLNRKYGWGEPEEGNVGSSVRKYAGAFRTPPHVVGGRKEPARPATDRPTRVSGGLALADTSADEDDPAF